MVELVLKERDLERETLAAEVGENKELRDKITGLSLQLEAARIQAADTEDKYAYMRYVPIVPKSMARTHARMHAHASAGKRPSRRFSSLSRGGRTQKHIANRNVCLLAHPSPAGVVRARRVSRTRLDCLPGCGSPSIFSSLSQSIEQSKIFLGRSSEYVNSILMARELIAAHGMSPELVQADGLLEQVSACMRMRIRAVHACARACACVCACLRPAGTRSLRLAACLSYSVCLPVYLPFCPLPGLGSIRQRHVR